MQNTTNHVMIFSQKGQMWCQMKTPRMGRTFRYCPFEELSFVPQMTHYHEK